MPYCHNCGTLLSENNKFCPSCGTPTQGSIASENRIQASTPLPPDQTTQSFQSTSKSPLQQNIIIVGKAKSVGVAFLLSFLFGPLGLLYASVIGGIVMFFVSLILFFLLPIVGIVISWIGCIIWACVAADQANKRVASTGNALINNQFQR